METTKIRLLQGVSGLDFAWAPGQVVELPADEASKWADGERAEYVGVEDEFIGDPHPGEQVGEGEPPRGDEVDLPGELDDEPEPEQPRPAKATAPRRTSRRK